VVAHHLQCDGPQAVGGGVLADEAPQERHGLAVERHPSLAGLLGSDVAAHHELGALQIDVAHKQRSQLANTASGGPLELHDVPAPPFQAREHGAHRRALLRRGAPAHDLAGQVDKAGVVAGEGAAWGGGVR
jgi:hypothetical protein